MAVGFAQVIDKRFLDHLDLSYAVNTDKYEKHRALHLGRAQGHTTQHLINRKINIKNFAFLQYNPSDPYSYNIYDSQKGWLLKKWILTLKAWMFQQKLPVVKIVLHTYAVSNGHVEYKEYTLFGKTTLPGCQMCKLARKKYFKVITNQKPTLCPCQWTRRTTSPGPTCARSPASSTRTSTSGRSTLLVRDIH